VSKEQETSVWEAKWVGGGAWRYHD